MSEDEALHHLQPVPAVPRGARRHPRALGLVVAVTVLLASCGSVDVPAVVIRHRPRVVPTTTSTPPPPPSTTIAPPPPTPPSTTEAPVVVTAPPVVEEWPTSLQPCGGDLPPCYVKQRESGGSYSARNNADPDSACGAWQIIGSTWADFGGYPDACSAPPAVQDAKARELWAGGAGCSHWSAC